MAYSRTVEFDEDFKDDEGGMNRTKSMLRDREPRAIGTMLSQNREELLKLRELIGMLGDRITPVLGPDRPEKHLEGANESPECSDIMRELDDHRALIRSAQRHLSELMDRIEL